MTTVDIIDDNGSLRVKSENEIISFYSALEGWISLRRTKDIGRGSTLISACIKSGDL